MAERLVLLAVHAHPDDESLGTGGTLAKYVAEGVETVLVCATKGEEGDIQNPDLDPSKIPAEISELRLKELDAACKVLGIRRVHFLGYRDSGMAGSASNAHPHALVNADLGEAAGRLVEIIREARPQVVITYNERGIYGHPDHIAVNRITVAAVDAAGDPERYRTIPYPPWSPRRLYYMAIPRSRLLRMKEILEGRGECFDWDIDFRSTPDEEITNRIDVTAYLQTKLRAIRCHASQIGPGSFFSRVDESFRTEALGIECYVCVKGCDGVSDGGGDLFHGIRETLDGPT